MTPAIVTVVAPAGDAELDGLAGQRSPKRQTEPEPDDPSEPFSRNYGSARQAATEGVLEAEAGNS